MAHALTADLRARDLHAAALADDALVADALVLPAVALPVLRGTEDALAEEPVLLGLQRPVVDGLGLRTSPLDHERICFEDASPILIASKLLMSIMEFLSPWARARLCSASCPARRSRPSDRLAFSLDLLLDSSAASPSVASTPDRSMPSPRPRAAGRRPRRATRRRRPPRAHVVVRDCISFSSTLNDSGIDGSAMFSPFTIASYAFTRPTVSSDLIVSSPGACTPRRRPRAPTPPSRRSAGRRTAPCRPAAAG